MTGRLAGKVAIVTGGARGQGEAEARLFVAEGASVVIADVLDDDGETVAADLGDAARYVHLDVTSESEWEAAVATARDTYGGVHVLVNNAGILGSMAPIERTSLDDYLRVVMVNQVGPFLGIKAVVPAMAASGGGSIVNISSVGGLWGLPMLSPYSSSKFALRGLTRTAAVELGRKGIRVNSVHPGGIDTAMTRLPGMADVDMAMFYKRLPVKRVGTVQEVANLVLFLASDESSYSTGAEFVIDGGGLAGDSGMYDTQ